MARRLGLGRIWLGLGSCVGLRLELGAWFRMAILGRLLGPGLESLVVQPVRV